MHLERFGNEEVEGIDIGGVYVFPKLDGTNASCWYNDGIHSGSRTRELSAESDNAGFHKATVANERLCTFLNTERLRLYGEWLVPHSFTGYRENTWRKFYVFDVFNDHTQQYLTYDEYQPLMEKYGLEYIPPLAIVKNGDSERFIKYLNENKYLCPDDGTPGEGIVLKNYAFYNKHGRQTWAKIVRQEFKELHHKAMGAPEVSGGKLNEEKILDSVFTTNLVDKVYDKIMVEQGGWRSQYIPRLLDTVFYDLVREELWTGLKTIKFGSVNFGLLKALTILRIKQHKKELF